MEAGSRRQLDIRGGRAYGTARRLARRLETHPVLRGRKADDPAVFIEMLQADLKVGILPFELSHLEAAREAFGRYGKRRGHPAQLNFGDCLSYAVSKVAGNPLLQAGRDFALTDIEPALRP